MCIVFRTNHSTQRGRLHIRGRSVYELVPDDEGTTAQRSPTFHASQL